FLVRRIEAPERPLPLGRYEVCLGRGPFSLENELRLLQDRRIDVLVTKASGGAAARAKLEAARELGLPVIMIRRPGRAALPSVTTVEDAMRWIADAVGDSPRIDPRPGSA